MVDRQRRRGTTEEDGVDGRSGSASRHAAVEEEPRTVEPRADASRGTASTTTETTETTREETESTPSRGGSPRRRRGAGRRVRDKSRRSVSRGFDSRRRRRRRRSRVDRLDEGRGASLDALLERARRALARVVDTRDASSTSRRECSYSKVRRLVSLCRKPSRDGVASSALSNSELDILPSWRARRNRADTAFEHFLDLVIALAEKFHATRRRGRRARHARHLRRRALRRPRPGNGDMSLIAADGRATSAFF